MGKSKTTKPAKKSNTPFLVIGMVLVLAIFGGWYYYSTSKQAPASNTASNTAANKATPAQRTSTIPPNAPRGASPPNQSGSPTALVTLEEFADYQCSSCAVAHPVLNEIKAAYGSKIRFIYRNFPLSIPAHDKSYDASVAAEAAGLQGKYWEFQNLLFNNQQLWTSSPNYKQLWKDYATRIGLNVEKWETDILGMVAKSRVDEDLKRGRAIGVSATPTLYVNGASVPYSEMNVAGLKKVIDAELQRVSWQNQPSANSSNTSDGSNESSLQSSPDWKSGFKIGTAAGKRITIGENESNRINYLAVAAADDNKAQDRSAFVAGYRVGFRESQTRRVSDELRRELQKAIDEQ